MEEQLISFETAKLAKEKRFNLQVTNYYNTNKIPYCETGIEYMSDKDTISNWNNGKGCYPTLAKDVNCSAPTQSLLQKWLREVHGIDITVMPEWQKEKRVYYVGFSYINSSNKIDIFFSKNNDVKVQYKTYEESLEIGLQEALKLI